ncbi:DUF2815 family protein [Hathewaya limosa]|uniref:DUF2815 family protein n=1 Tax=Hathewaya limosa TaxID=1536 RepID=A0ABU0JS50_HATLI|nr:DUF2815 family protein [Hathewaya limosa]MDQ0479927.1 hypothetical protein [Hathewaya limosa]
MSKNTKVVIPGRLSYTNLFEPKSINGSEPKYSVSIIIPKGDKKTLTMIQKAVEDAKKEGIGKFGGKIPKNLKTPLRDGDIDRPDDPAYENSYFINTNSKDAPQIVDKRIQPILDRSEVYSGCYGKVSVNFYAFNVNGNRGIAAGLGNVQKLRDGESLGGHSRAEDDFEIEEDDDDDFMS